MDNVLKYVLLSIVLSVVISAVVASITTYSILGFSVQQILLKIDTNEVQPYEKVQASVPAPVTQETQSPVSGQSVKVEEQTCTEECDDSNPCTFEYCNATTNFKCKTTVLKGEVEGCKGMEKNSCYRNTCSGGICTLVYSATCCGNDKCDSGEDISLCPRDCSGSAAIQAEPQTTSTPLPSQTTSLATAISIEKDPIVRGNVQTITIKVSAGSSVEGASVASTVTYVSGTKKDFSGTTNSNGEYVYSWQIGGSSTPGTFSVTATASKDGFTSASTSNSFQVTTASG